MEIEKIAPVRRRLIGGLVLLASVFVFLYYGAVVSSWRSYERWEFTAAFLRIAVLALVAGGLWLLIGEGGGKGRRRVKIAGCLVIVNVIMGSEFYPAVELYTGEGGDPRIAAAAMRGAFFFNAVAYVLPFLAGLGLLLARISEVGEDLLPWRGRGGMVRAVGGVIVGGALYGAASVAEVMIGVHQSVAPEILVAITYGICLSGFLGAYLLAGAPGMGLQQKSPGP